MPGLLEISTGNGRARGAAKVRPGKANLKRGLAEAFLTFTQAAGSLERSYTLLQNEVERLHGELGKAGAELEHSLEENARVRAFLSQVVENLPCGVVVGGPGGKLQILNPQARHLLGIPAEWNAQAGSPLPARLIKLLGGECEGAAGAEQEWAPAEQADGCPIGISRAPLRTGKGREEEKIWILRDLTEQKRLAAERERTQQSLALAEITALLAHEIRNPLGSMELFAGLLEDAVSGNPETRQWVNHLRAGLRMLSATVNNVLQFHSQTRVQLHALEIDRLLREVSEFLLPVARQRSQQIRYESNLANVYIRADANLLKQVFLNLALNALRAMSPGGTLRFALGWAPQFPGGLVRAQVQDEGRGIAPELLEMIFEPGFTTTPGSPGLGLAVCKKIAQQHGGVIEVRSKPGEGTCFSLVLPVAGEKV